MGPSGEVVVPVPMADLDIVTGDSFLAEVRRTLRDLPDGDLAAGVVLDLANVRFIDSIGLRALILLRADLLGRDSSLVLRNADRRAIRLLRITGLTEALPLESA